MSHLDARAEEPPCLSCRPCVGGAPAPAQPAASLGSWDMGAALRQQQEQQQQQAAAAAAMQQPARLQPQPYCPPWAPQPSQASASMALVPASAAFSHGFNSMPAFPTSAASSFSAGAPPQHAPYPSTGSFSYSSQLFSQQAQSYYASSSNASTPSPTRPAPHRPPPRPAASPAEEKANSLLVNQLGAFNLHAETVSALKPSPRLAPAQQHSPGVPLAAMR